MKRWKEDVHGIGGLDYIVFKGVPMRESKWGDVVELDQALMEKQAAAAVIGERVPIRGKELRFLRKCLGFTFETLGRELDVNPSTLCKWEQKLNERLQAFNEIALRVFFAERLGVDLPGKHSELMGTTKSPTELILKAS